MRADREFLFNYRYANSDWGISIFAASEAEAKEKMKAVALARYEGEVARRISVPGATLIGRLIRLIRR